MSLQEALEVALLASREAGDLLRRDFHRTGGARGKIDKAEADVEAEHAIRARLFAAFPGWSYLGEETGRVEGSPGAPLWLVDPNDGTRDYLCGRRGSAVSIGLLVDGRPVLGVVFAFAYPDDAGDEFAWAEGCGPLRRNGRALEVRRGNTLTASDVVLASSKGDRDPEGNLRCVAPARFRSVASIAHRLALVAAGEATAATSLYAPGAWDYAAGHALLRASGGILVDEKGQEVTYQPDGTSHTLRALGGSPEVARDLAARAWDGVRTQGPWPSPGGLTLVPGHAVSDPAGLARAQGCLLGQVAGDSLGAAGEGLRAEQVAKHPRYAGSRWLLVDGEITLGGQPTDDSEMALALARAVVERDAYDPEAVLAAYREWHRSGPFSLGQTTHSALVGQPLADSQANGSLMRASPLGILAHALDADEAADLGRRDSRLTHPHPVCQDAVAAYVVAIAAAIREGDARAAHADAVDWARRVDASAPVLEALHAAVESPVRADGADCGWVLVTLRNAFFDLLHAEGPEEGMRAAVARGGDTDTNAAVAGALLGAVHGRPAIPDQWRQMILSCRSHPLRAPRPRPPVYWPTDVFELSERLLLAGQRLRA